ncbi:MAG: hypothetical protein UW03_C0015G0064 [Candidatus Peregrinibacteria bacterium GW2011_GWA2_43_8]|nr:MAG: hypothetical protein UW03_C0015G0064 [Candidatus Peregrinibacteria bacterium GW2011_GWA2_43_8]
MTRSLRELDADLSKVTPERAKYDYWNAIQNLLVCMPDPMDDEVFQQRLREWADRRSIVPGN